MTDLDIENAGAEPGTDSRPPYVPGQTALLLDKPDGAADTASGRDSILCDMVGIRHVGIAGNMGVGKSTLTAALALRLGARAFYETVEDHPYLERFYEDMRRWGFQSQFFFLSQAFSQHSAILRSDRICVQDRTIYEHFEVFAASLHDQGLLDPEDFLVLREHYESLTAVVPGPDLMIYLRASVPTLLERIHARDRGCETSVSADYLAGLDRRYESWMAQYEASDVLVVDTDDIDIHVPEHRERLLGLIETRVLERASALAVA